MIIWIMFAMAAGVGGSFLAGTAEMNLLGTSLSQSPFSSIFTLLGTWNNEGFIKAALFGFANFPDILGAFINALAWNYAVLGPDPITGDANILGLIVRFVLVAVVTFPLLYGFFIEVVPRFLPWGKG